MHPQDIDPAFGNWLAGFIDGEACFLIFQRKAEDQTSYVCQFTLELRDDDLSILQEIQGRLGVGNLVRDVPNRGNPRARYAIVKKSELLRLVDVLDRHPLRAKKARDYAIWREAVLLWAKTQVKRNRWGALPCDWDRIAELYTQLRAVRRYDPPSTWIPLRLPQPEREPPPTLWED